MPRPIRAVLFDFDGVLADTEGLHYETLAAVLEEEGITLTREVNDREYIGIDVNRSFEKAFRDAGKELSACRCPALVTRKSELFIAAVDRVSVFPGIPELVEQAAARAACGIVSGALRAEIHAVLRRHDLDRFFPHIVAADDGLPSKPSPAGYLRLLELLRIARGQRIDAAECLVVEDSVPGIRAARSAGMRCAALANSHAPDALREADVVFASASEWSWHRLP